MEVTITTVWTITCPRCGIASKVKNFLPPTVNCMSCGFEIYDREKAEFTVADLPDMLDHIFNLQSDFDARLVKTRGNQNPPFSDANFWILKHADAMIHECIEMRDWVNWKWWKNEKKLTPEIISEVKMECVDILHFLVSLCLKLGMSSKDLSMMYLAKNKVNHKR